MGLRGPGAKGRGRPKLATGKKRKRNVKPLSGPVAEQVIAFCEQLHVTSGKFAGTTLRLRDWQKQIVRAIYAETDGKRQIRTALITMPRKNGKGLALDTPIPTPEGWSDIGDLKVGDRVFDDRGEQCRVTFVSPVHVGLKCWRLEFSDGTSIVADEEHQWLTRHSFTPWRKVRINGSGNGGDPVIGIVTTPEIAASVFRPRADGGVEHNHSLDVVPAIVTDDVELPLDPYLLGAWLGDGETDAASITSGDQDLDHMVAQIGATGNSYRVHHNRGLRAATIFLNAGRSGDGKKRTHTILREIGVLGNKHIPGSYLRASISQRWSLLQGLMDTDGTVMMTGRSGATRCEYSSKMARLANDVAELARSLGLKSSIVVHDAKLYGRVVGKRYRVTFTAVSSQPIFRLPRKQERLRDVAGRRSGTLKIVACDPIESVPTRCIQVDSPSSLFLAGRGFTPTHNTQLAAALALCHMLGPVAESRGQVYSAAADLIQASLIFNEVEAFIMADETLQERCNVQRFAKKIEVLSGPGAGTIYRPLTSDARKAHGLSPSFAIYDELAQAPDRNLYDNLRTGTGAREHPLFIVISTQSADPNHVMSEEVDYAESVLSGKVNDPHYFAYIAQAPKDADPWDEKTWFACNPALDDFRNLEDMRIQAAKAKIVPSEEPTFRNHFLNQRVDVAATPWIGRDPVEASLCDIDWDDFAGAECYMSADLGGKHDLTALALSFPDGKGGADCFLHYWTPRDTMKEREDRDRIPYRQWVSENLITAVPGKSIDYAFVAGFLAETVGRYNVLEFAFDRWRIDDLKREMDEAGIESYIDDGKTAAAGLKMVPFGQGFRDFSPALDIFETALINGKLRIHRNKVTLNHAANCMIEIDAAGNRKFTKRKSTGRIDGMVALAMCAKRSLSAEVQEESYYEMLARERKATNEVAGRP